MNASDGFAISEEPERAMDMNDIVRHGCLTTEYDR